MYQTKLEWHPIITEGRPKKSGTYLTLTHLTPVGPHIMEVYYSDKYKLFNAIDEEPEDIALKNAFSVIA